MKIFGYMDDCNLVNIETTCHIGWKLFALWRYVIEVRN